VGEDGCHFFPLNISFNKVEEWVKMFPMPPGIMEELLILAKTYPNPSTQYREISCVAAVNKQGFLRRLFPVPYRFLQGDQQFKKWEWITARVSKARKDHRPESYNIDVDSIHRREVIPTNNGWRQRLKWIDPHISDTPSNLEIKRQQSGITLGCIRPTRIVELQIKKSSQPDWTEVERQKLIQDCLFDSKEVKGKSGLQKVPYDFYYSYTCLGSDGLTVEARHKITDWEAGALYWNCRARYGTEWERYFRMKFETDFASKRDLVFLLGTIHRFPDQWLIVGIYYPPKPSANPSPQLNLFSLDE